MSDLTREQFEKQLERENNCSHLVQLQYEREADSKAAAKTKLQASLQKDIDNVNCGSSIWGIPLRNQLLGIMIEKVEEKLGKAGSRNGECVAEMYRVVERCTGLKFKRTAGKPMEKVEHKFWDDALAVHITLIVCLDAACAPKATKLKRSTDPFKDHRPTAAEVRVKIAQELHRQMVYKLVKANFANVWENMVKSAEQVEGAKSAPGHMHDRMDQNIESLRASFITNDAKRKEQGLEPEELHLGTILPKWTYAEQQTVGSFFLSIASELKVKVDEEDEVGKLIFELEKGKDEDGNVNEYLVLSKHAECLRKDLIKDAERHAFEALPMLVPPRKMTADHLGGYLTNACVDVKLNDSFKGEIQLSQQHIDFFNHQMEVPFKINKFVLSLLEELAARNLQLGAFKLYDIDRDHSNRRVHQRLDIPDAYWSSLNKVQQDALLASDPKAFKKAKKERSLDFKRQQVQVDDSELSRRLLHISRRVADDQAFYITIQPDFRSRYYPRNAYLNYQAGDLGRALLEFAEPYPIDEQTQHYLSIHLANSAGLDKVSFADRLQWVDDNLTQIKQIGNILEDWDSGWAALQEYDAEDPLQLAAACHEYVELFINKSRDVTHLPCSVDATCSGQQLLCGQTKDHELAKLVNVVPTNTPGDVYRESLDQMLSKAQQELSQFGCFTPKNLKSLKTKIGRAIAKGGFMSGQYGSSLKTQLEDMFEVASDKGLKFSAREYALFTGKLPSKASDDAALYSIKESNSLWLKSLEEVTNIKRVFDWFARVASAVHKSGATGFVVPLPTGSVMTQHYYKTDTIPINTFQFGSSRYKRPKRTNQQVQLAEVDVWAWRRSAAPNAIHSLDASLLCLALGEFEYSFSGTHDSVSTYAGKPMETLHKRLREAYVEVSNFNLFEQVLKANGLEETEELAIPEFGDLDVTLALQSDYLFC